MNNVKTCGQVIQVQQVEVWPGLTAEVGTKPKDPVVVIELGSAEQLLLLPYGATWRLVNKLLALLARSDNGHAKDARSMLHHGHTRSRQS